jgi:glycosyltransferase involved in cell wall biosynthesis
MNNNILVIAPDVSRGIKDYIDFIYPPLETNLDTSIKVKYIPKQSVYDTEEQVINNLLKAVDSSQYTAVHIHYSIFLSDFEGCIYSSMEIFSNFLSYIHNEKKIPVYITFHGHISLNFGQGMLSGIQTKIIKKLFKTKLIPEINKCKNIVHSYVHKDTIEQLGIVNVRVISPFIHPAYTTRSKTRDHDDYINIVIPGTRSLYKNYQAVLDATNHILEDKARVYISDEGQQTDEEMFKLIKGTDTRQRVNFIRFSKDKDTYLKQLSQFDIAVLPYKEEVPHSGSLQDCLSVGLFCICLESVEFLSHKERYNCIEVCKDLSLSLPFYITRYQSDSIYRRSFQDNIKKYYKIRSLSNMCQDYSNLYNVNYSSINLKTDSKTSDRDIVNIFMCCRDNEDSLPITLRSLQGIESESSSDFKYYILENDSKDNTPSIIEEFYTNVQGTYNCFKSGADKWSSEPGAGRIRDMANYRNEMKSLCREWDNSKYSFIVDTEVIFSDDIIKSKTEYLDNTDECAMITPYGTVGDSSTYYDMFAYRSHLGDQELYITDQSIPVSVQSAFGGFAGIRTNILQRCRWDIITGDMSEHIPFCQQVREYGSIVIDPQVRVQW